MADLETTECEDHFLINCVTCKERSKPKPPIVEHEPSGAGVGNFRTVRSLEIVAKFDSICPRCEDEIIEGMTIIHSEAFDAFVHPNC